MLSFTPTSPTLAWENRFSMTLEHGNGSSHSSQPNFFTHEPHSDNDNKQRNLTCLSNFTSFVFWKSRNTNKWKFTERFYLRRTTLCLLWPLNLPRLKLLKIRWKYNVPHFKIHQEYGSDQTSMFYRKALHRAGLEWICPRNGHVYLYRQHVLLNGAGRSLQMGNLVACHLLSKWKCDQM